MFGYFVGEIDVIDSELYETYRPMAREVVLKHGGEYLAASSETTAIEGSAPAYRVVIIRFPSFDAVKEWFYSDDYAEALALRQRCAKSRTYAVEGVDVPVAEEAGSACYFVGEREIHDQAAFDDYVAKAGPIVEQYGGDYLVRGGRVEALEGEPPLPRVVITRFASIEAYLTWLHSPEYDPVARIRKAAAECRTFVVEGI